MNKLELIESLREDEGLTKPEIRGNEKLKQKMQVVGIFSIFKFLH
jgi:hypothetical protein